MVIVSWQMFSCVSEPLYSKLQNLDKIKYEKLNSHILTCLLNSSPQDAEQLPSPTQQSQQQVLSTHPTQKNNNRSTNSAFIKFSKLRPKKEKTSTVDVPCDDLFVASMQSRSLENWSLPLSARDRQLLPAASQSLPPERKRKKKIKIPPFVFLNDD